jgi:hypothetical protein
MALQQITTTSGAKSSTQHQLEAFDAPVLNLGSRNHVFLVLFFGNIRFCFTGAMDFGRACLGS